MSLVSRVLSFASIFKNFELYLATLSEEVSIVLRLAPEDSVGLVGEVEPQESAADVVWSSSS
jgi:hypothetical protein